MNWNLHVRILVSKGREKGRDRERQTFNLMMMKGERLFVCVFLFFGSLLLFVDFNFLLFFKMRHTHPHPYRDNSLDNNDNNNDDDEREKKKKRTQSTIKASSSS